MKKILAVASGGGHWVQLLRLRPAFAGCDITYVTVQDSYQEQVPNARFYCVTDATRWSRWALVRMIAEIAWIVLKERPDVVISTGAAPGVVALRVGKWLGARTIWLDSIANVEQMSLSGQRVRSFTDLRLSQWPEVAKAEGCAYKGAVL
jgi:UDP-N-acetylglucosamine:LPS N-acetylglucosamine transferase